MPIEFSCPHCQGTLRLKEKFAGQRGGCKHCGGEIVVPSAGASADLELSPLDDSPRPQPRPVARPAVGTNGTTQPPSAARPASQPAPSRLGATQPTAPSAKSPSNGQPLSGAPKGANMPAADLIRFACHKCGATIKTPAGAAGRAVACPRCAERLRVPGAPATHPSAPPGVAPVATPRPIARPIAAAASPPLDGLDLLPENDDLEIVPEKNSLLDALDDSISLAPAGPALKPLPPRPVTPAAKKRPRRADRESSGALGVSLKAIGGGVITLLFILGICARVYRMAAPMSGGAGNVSGTTVIEDLQQLVNSEEQCVQTLRTIVDGPSAQRQSAQLMRLLVSTSEKEQAIEQYKTKRVSRKDVEEIQQLQLRNLAFARQIQAEMQRIVAIPQAGEIIQRDIEQTVNQNPESVFAKSYRAGQADGR